MLIHVVRPDDNWVLQKIGDLLVDSGDRIESASPQPRQDVDVNFFCNYALFTPTRAFDAGWFTHMPAHTDDDGWRRKLFSDIASKADFCVAQSRLTATHLPQDKTAVWHGMPVVTAERDQLVLGICATNSRRKRFDRLAALCHINRVDVRLTGGGLSETQLADFFRTIDYLVVTSDTEGGPIPVLEALASGVPVIAPNVGFCWDYPVIKYEDTEDLIRIVTMLRPADDVRQRAAEELEQSLGMALNRNKESTCDTFVLNGQAYRYMYHGHNCGFPGKRRTERTVELSIADDWLQRHPTAIEVGAVTPYYWPKRVREIIDPVDAHRRVSDLKSVFGISLRGRDVLSISTVQRIGESRYGQTECRTPLEAMEKITREARNFLITWPLGVSTALDRWATEHANASNARTTDNLEQNLDVKFLVRRADECWEECGLDEAQVPYGGQSAPWANAIVVLQST